MRISFRRLSNDEHELVVHRDDGTTDRMRCETRSYLDHDLIHLAVEAQAGLPNGFWGTLARGVTLDELADHDNRQGDFQAEELMRVEQLVGVMTGATRNPDPPSAAAVANWYFEQTGVEPPVVIDAAYVAGVTERLRRLRGHWRATKFGDEMVVKWPDADRAAG